MRRRMVEPRSLPVSRVDPKLDFVADLDTAFFHFAAMGGKLRRRVLGVGYFDQISACRRDRAAVAHLPAGFSIERRLGGQQFDLFTFYRFLFTVTAAVNRQHRRFAVEAVVADEANRTVELNLPSTLSGSRPSPTRVR